MQHGPPRLWQLTPDSSPLPIPEQHWFQDKQGILGIDLPEIESDELNLDSLFSSLSKATLSDGRVLKDVYDFSSCKALLALGELANPYRLNDIGIEKMIVLNVRIEGICRVWADAIDSREVNPGVHHVTLARTSGWWERAWLAIAPISVLKGMVDWLDDGKRAWLPKRLAEGNIRLDSSVPTHPSSEEVNWDGNKERVDVEMPENSGPILDNSSILVPIHTRSGAYNNRGRLARVVHVPQRIFHHDLFRLGSSKSWDSILETR